MENQRTFSDGSQTHVLSDCVTIAIILFGNFHFAANDETSSKFMYLNVPLTQQKLKKDLSYFLYG